METKVRYLITGGTGTLGQALTKELLKKEFTDYIKIFSRGELLQWEMSRRFNDSRLEFMVGDVRDFQRVCEATENVNIVIHTAALKQIPTCESNPEEAVKTNIIGALNIQHACNSRTHKVIGISSDKAVYPVNLYGTTKKVMEKTFTEAGFSCVRYGNVAGSRGSIIPLLLEQKELGAITLTDKRMTRFWITQREAALFILDCLDRIVGGEIFIPKLPSFKVTDLVEAIAPKAEVKIIGIRKGEKLHEVLLEEEEVERTRQGHSLFIVGGARRLSQRSNNPLPKDFKYSSDKNHWWLTKEDLEWEVKICLQQEKEV